jgi:4-amino-4-deoxy-L-arabinose transferase-like glycosyltransferase
MAQADKSYTLWIGLFFYALSLWELKSLSFSPETISKLLPQKLEGFILLLILGLACFFRLYRIDSLPAGMHTDQGLSGLFALRIEHEGWRPFYELYRSEVPIIPIFYQLAVWFSWVGDSLFHFRLFFTIQAIIALIFFYVTIRQLAGPQTALLSLFILAVTRWNWIETRTAYPSTEVIFYLFGTLCFWVYGFQKQKVWAFILSAVFMGAGLYTYQVFKLVPFLFVVYAVWEYFEDRKKPSIRFSTIALYLSIVFLLALPLLNYFWHERIISEREKGVFIGAQIVAQKSLKPLWDVWTGNALMFNRTGDEIARHNIPGHRMLDDVTGVLFILGLGLAFRQWKHRDAFYFLTGFFVLELAGFLSNDPNNSNRLVVLTAFAAYFAGSFLEFFWSYWEQVFPSRKKIIAVTAGIVLAAMTFQNAYTYFVVQANNEECHLSLGLEQMTIGQTIGDLQTKFPGRFHYFLTPFYINNHVVHFLGYSGMENSVRLDLTAIAQGNFPKDKDAIFFLEQNKTAAFELLKTLLPEGHETLLKNNEGNVLLYRYDVSASALRHFHKWNRGLTGAYWNSLEAEGKPGLVRVDPVLNFTSKQDFPFRNYPPFFIRWKGRFIAEIKGSYRIRLLTTDRATIWVDGKEVFDSQKPGEEMVLLRKGPHFIRIEYQKTEGDSMSVHLIWMKPHETQWEPVPPAAFGSISSN